MLNTDTDKTNAYPLESLNAASATYAFLREFQRRWRSHRPLGPAWEQISTEIADYLSIQGYADKDAWLIPRLVKLTGMSELEIYRRIELHWTGIGKDHVEPYSMREEIFP